MDYKEKEKIKNFLSQHGLLNFVFSIYRLKHYLRHKRCNFEKKRRMAGENDARYMKLRQYENIHAGKRCFVIATGPSLTIDDLEKTRDEYTFSMNSIIKIFDKTSWRPTYYGIQDRNVYDIFKDDPTFNSLKGKFVADLVAYEFDVPQNSVIYPLDMLDHMYYKLAEFKTVFSDNAYGMVYDGATITYSILQLAVYMGFNEIYLLGCDCDFSGSKQHFVDYGKSVTVQEDNLIKAYMVARQYADTHGIKIYNATRGGKLEVFERVDFDSLFDKETEK